MWDRINMLTVLILFILYLISKNLNLFKTLVKISLMLNIKRPKEILS